MDITTKVKILKYLESPQTRSNVTRKFGINKYAAHRFLQTLESAKIAEVKWEKGIKFYKVNFNEIIKDESET